MKPKVCCRPLCYYRQSHLRIKKHLINALHIYKMFLQLVIIVVIV